MKKKFGNKTKFWVGLGIFCDMLMGLTASFSDLGDNRDGAPWGNPLFVMHVVCAGIGFFGFIWLFIMLFLKQTEFRANMIAKSTLPILVLWIAGVTISILNVLFDYY